MAEQRTRQRPERCETGRSPERMTGWAGWTVSRVRDSVTRELPVERRGIDAEDVGGAALVAALALQNPHDVRALDHVERRVGARGAVCHERLGLSLRDALRKRSELD